MKVYLIGIGGISMSAIAYLLQDRGDEVLGSDLVSSEITDALIKNGIKVNFSQKKENITEDIDLIVYTAAIHNDNEEIIRAKELNIKMLNRAECLGIIMQSYKTNIDIAGTHGKTTTTSMLSKVMLDLNYNPTISIGAVYDYINSNFHIGSKDYFICESCEYTNSFLHFTPQKEIITNIDEDHLDFFKDINDIRNSFKKFINLMDEKGTLVISGDIPDLLSLLTDYKGKVITYGEGSSNDYVPKNIKFDIEDFATFDLYHKNKLLGNVKLSVLGKHNVLNAVAIFALMLDMGAEFYEIKKSIETFRGANRRLEKKAVINGITIFDDYAHHPNEIKASLTALKTIQTNRLFVIYQPHTYTRTKALFNDFVESLKEVDDLIMAKIYEAREKDIYNISSNDVILEINKKYDKNAIYIDNFDDIKDYIIKNATTGDIVCTMGAGDVFKVSDDLITYYKNNINK